MEVKQLLAFVLILLNHVYQVSAVCNAPNGFENAKVVRGLLEQQGVYEEGVELEYECNNGFRLTTGYASRCRNGQWTEIRCDRISCKWLPAPDHGKRLDSNSYMGNTTQFACNEGYRLIGYEYLLCRADGYWRPSQPPVCKPVNCGPLPTPVNGNAFQATRNGNVNMYGHVVKFSCEFGYDLIKGSKERRCQADGTWSGTQPVCEEPSCPDFDPVYNGQVYYNNDEKNAIFDVAEIECNEGSDVFPENTQYVRCIDRNTWDINNITCERHLTIPPQSNMKLFTGQGRDRSRIWSQMRFKSRTLLQVECENKHELFDDQTNKYYDVNRVQVRIFNGTVTPELPTCRKERCNLEAKDCSYMDTNGNRLVGKVDHDTVVVKKCNPNFEFELSNKRNEPSQTFTCNQGVIYFPRCIPKRCEIPADRRAKLSGRYNYFNAGDLIDNEGMVEITCEARKELYYPETQTYEENSKIFTSTCTTGVWSNNIFPICREKRCNLVADDCSYMDTDGNTLVGKVDHDTMVVKRCNPNFEFKPLNKRKEPRQETTCNQGYINFHQCIPKRCEIPHDRHATLGGVYLKAGELVDSEKTVVTDCRQGEELYYPESKTYANTFTTTCRVGLWSDDDFPKCKEERCTSPSDSDGTRFLLNGKSVKTGTKLEHGTILTKSCNQGYEDITNSSTECFSGGWIGDEPCTGKPCTLPAIEHTKKNRMSKQLAHNKEAKVKCSNGYEMMHSDVEIQKIRPKCHLGNLKPSLDDIKCVPKGCSGTSNADVYRTSASGKIEEEPASSFEHKEFATVKCHDHHVLSEGSKPVHDRESVTTQCMLGKWEPDYACKQDACRVDIPENGYLWIENVNRKRNGTTKMIHGHMGTIYCEPNYTLYNDTIALRNDGYPIACVGNKLNATLPKCVKSVLDAEEEATESPVDEKASTTTIILENTAKNGVPDAEEDADMEYNAFDEQIVGATETFVDERFSTTPTENNATVFATKDATISSTTSDAPLSSTTPFSESPVTTEDGVDYDYAGVNEIKSEETCPDPANGRVVNSYLYYYNVVCADGYELVVLENDVDYKCSNGKWISKNYEWEPECKELTCDITDEILAVMKVFKRVQGDEMYVSDVRDEIQPDQKYYFECKQENHEPVKRLFTCSGGNWTAAERDPNWKMQIDKMEPTCRKAVCDPACQFGGTCGKDGMCKCVPGTKGKACEIPVCNTACATNGGKCEAPNTCKCEEPRYGTNCEIVGCGRPDLPEGVRMKETKNFFKVGDVLSSDQLTCSLGYVLSNTTRCTGNHTWSGKAECSKETHYELEVKVGSSQWAGSYGSLYVTILSAEDGIIHRMAFEKPQFKGLYPGRSYTLSSSTTGQTDKVDQLKLLLGPDNNKENDNLEIDHVRLTLQRAANNIIEDYTFSNVGWLDKDMPKFVRPDTGCLPPANVKFYEKKPTYKTGDVIQKSNVICSHPSVESTTCLQTGKWSSELWCRKGAVFHLEYRLGDDYFAGSGDILYISFVGSFGHTPWYLMSRGRRNRGKTYNTDIDGVYVGQIHTITITKHGWNNDMQIDYIKLTVLQEDKEEKYMFRIVGWIGNTPQKITPEITVDQPELPSCQNDFDISAGWVDKNLRRDNYDFQHVKSDEECKNFCRMDVQCKVAAVSGRKNLTCKIVYTDRESAFKSGTDTSTHRLYKKNKRKC